MDYIQLAATVITVGLLTTAIIQLRLFSTQIVQQQQHATEQLSLLSQEIKLQYEWKQKSKALDYSLSKNKNLHETRLKLDHLFKNIHKDPRAIPYDEIKETLDNDKTTFTSITSLLAHWENMALAIETKIIDEDIAFEMTAGIVIDYYKTFEEFIKIRRDSNKRAYDCLMKLAPRWELRRNTILSNSNPESVAFTG